jgi:protein subunit release factor A
MPVFPVSVKKAKLLAARMEALKCSERDLHENYFRGRGVELFHLPTGVRIRCSKTRSQGLNRFLARRLLLDELEARLQNKTRHEVKAKKIREDKGRRLKRKGIAEQLERLSRSHF